MSTSVLLLRSPSEDGGPDKYEEAFRARGYRPVSVPVLETVHKNLDTLRDVVKRGGRIADEYAGGRYAGVIVTSGRACEAWRVVVQQLEESSGAQDRQQDTVFDWSTVPFYAVGAATASALSSIHDACPASRYVPHDIRGGANAGTAEKLAHFIVSDLPEGGSRRLLYLTGDKNRDTLPSILGEAEIDQESLQVYATQGSSRFEEDLARVLEADAPDGAGNWWIVHFAPSAAKTVSPTLVKYFNIPIAEEASSSARRAHVAAIGPTTSTFLRDELRVEVTVVAEKPTPDALAEGIAEWYRTHELGSNAGRL